MKCNEQSVCIAYSYRNEIQRELLRSLPLKILTQTQSGKVVRTAAGILRLNLLECSLLAWLLKRSKYSLVDLSHSSHGISLFEEDQNKQLLLLILLNAYYVKTYLNQNSLPELDLEILSLIPEFSKTYQSWRPDSELRNDILLEINQSFNNWTLPQRKNKPDYNQLVNKILELSKTYNVNANEEALPNKKRKPNEESQKQAQQDKSIIEQDFTEQRDERMILRSQQRMRRSKFSELSQQQVNFIDIFEPEERFNNDFLKKSTKNNMSLSGFMNFSNDMRETKNLFNSRFNINNSIVESGRLFPAEDKPLTRPKIKPTQSFDRP